MFSPIFADQTSGPRAVQTFNVGVLQVPESSIVQLIEPLIGLGPDLEFLVYRTGPGPLSWWQSVATPQLALCCLEPFLAGLDPEMSIDQHAVEAIGATGPDDITVFTVVVLENDASQTRTNLRAPILVSRSTGKGVQIILEDTKLPVKGYLAELASKIAKA